MDQVSHLFQKGLVDYHIPSRQLIRCILSEIDEIRPPELVDMVGWEKDFRLQVMYNGQQILYIDEYDYKKTHYDPKKTKNNDKIMRVSRNETAQCLVQLIHNMKLSFYLLDQPCRLKELEKVNNWLTPIRCMLHYIII